MLKTKTKMKCAKCNSNGYKSFMVCMITESDIPVYKCYKCGFRIIGVSK